MPWDVATLKEHLEKVLDERDARYEERLQAQKEATSQALVAAKEMSLTELQSTRDLAARSVLLADQKMETHNAIRPWVQGLLDAALTRINSVEDASERRDAAIEQRVARFENREEGVKLSTKVLIGAITLFATLIGIYFALN